MRRNCVYFNAMQLSPSLRGLGHGESSEPSRRCVEYRIAAKYSNAARKKAVFESILGHVRAKIVAFESCTS